MSTATVAHDALLPRPPGGLAPGAVLALLVHAGLIAALTAAVDWRSQPTEVVSAELWAAVPVTAAPRGVEAPPPPPVAPSPTPAPTPEAPPAPVAKPVPKVEAPPPDAQIATERAERLKREAAAERERNERAERQKAERAEADKLKQAEAAKQREAEQRDKQKQAEAAKAEALKRTQAEEKRLAEQREANLQRMLGQAGATGSPSSTGTAARDAAPSASYVGRLVASIKPNIVFAETVPGNPAAEVEVRATSTGTILARRLLKSSGHKEWDEAVLRAIDRTGTLPRDTDGRVPSAIVITFRPQE